MLLLADSLITPSNAIRVLSLSTWLFLITVTVAASLIGSGFCQGNTTVYERPYCLSASTMSAQSRLVVIFSGLLSVSHAFNLVATMYLLRTERDTPAMEESTSFFFRAMIKQVIIDGLLIMVCAGSQIAFGTCQSHDIHTQAG